MTSSRRKVLLVGWDAADWKIIQPLLDRGELPVLEKIVNGGVMGNLASVRPMLSPMLWTSIATGKRPFKHGVHGFTEVDYELNQVVPVSSSTRSCKAVWNILNQNGFKTHVTGWFATHPAEPLDGAVVSDRFAVPTRKLDRDSPLPKGTIHPARLEEQLSILRLRPAEIPGDVLPLFVRDAAKVNQAHDKRLHEIAIHLAECFSVHAAATYLLEHEPWDFAAVYYRAIDWLCHHFMEFHPPRMSGVHESDFERYHDVVNSAYRLHDLLLGRLLQLAGPDTTVLIVSDHGFKSGRDRPQAVPNVPAGIVAWHRMTGILAMRGNGLRQDELIHGASILDITPTILALFGLPIGSDMDGRVLLEAFSETPVIERTESWDKIDSDKKIETRRLKRSPDEEKELIRQFVEIGYIDNPGDNPQEAIKSTERENRWMLAQSYLEATRLADALPLLESVYEEWPEREDFRSELALCQLNLGLIEEAHETLGEILTNEQPRQGQLLLRAAIEYRRNHFAEGLKLLEQAEAIDSNFAGLQNQIGLMRLRLRQPQLAKIAFRKAIELNADDAYAHLGLASAHILPREFEAAAESALQALGLKFDIALAHYQLGVALTRLGEAERAVQAFQTALRYQPALNRAHRYLAYLYSRKSDGAAQAARHRQFLSGRIARRETSAAFQKKLRGDAQVRAQERAEGRRRLREQTGNIDKKEPSASEPMEFLVVSGLPRSGTSLMMQMLDAAGVPIMTDESRSSDEGNPRGYFEWQEIKQLPKNPYIIEKANGRVVKIISMLLPALPRKHKFRIIFMQRAIEEVAASQEKLRLRLSSNAAPEREKMTSWLQQHRDRIVDLLRESPNVDLLEIDYADLIENPRPNLERVVEFAKIHPAKIDIMAAAVDPKLRHFDLAHSG